MTNAQIKAALLKYDKFFPGLNQAQFNGDAFMPEQPQKGTSFRTLLHLKWMIAEAIKFVDQSEAGIADSIELTAKAMRWLCFIQGALWVNGYCSINELRADNTRLTEEK